jgi:hypothetical protein
MKCPVCRADNDEKPACRRCKADLTLMWAVEERRGGFLRAAHNCLRLGQYEQALDHLGRVRELRQGADADRLMALVNMMAGDFAEALRLHKVANLSLRPM